MIPIRDDAPRYGTPYVTYFLVALNTLIFLAMWVGLPAPAQQMVNVFGFVPVKLTALLHGAEYVNVGGMLQPVGSSVIVTIFTAMFLHASFLHLLGNMWFLWIFGDNIEGYLGHGKYLLMYLLAGIAAMLLQTVLNPTSGIPNVGASGAIAGVMGAYFILYPSSRVLTLVPFFFVFFIWVPAWIMLGYWFIIQFLSGAATSIAYTRQSGGIAFWAHVGGFVAGVTLIKLFPGRVRRFRYDAW